MRRLRSNTFQLHFCFLAAVILIGGGLWAQSRPAAQLIPGLPMQMFAGHETDSLPRAIALPRMAPELALQAYEQRQQQQASAPPAYSAEVVIDAELPATAQRGEYQLKRQFIAPRTLLFKPVKFIGDSFVKTNVITRLLQSEVDRVSKGDGAQTAISSRNYKFSYKGIEDVNGAPVHVFHVKPRKKRLGLFKGRIYVDASTGALRRAEGTLVRSPSLFIKKVEFAQDYTEVGGYMLPVHMYSVAKTRLVGRAIVDIKTSDYDLSAAALPNAATSAAGAQPAGSPSSSQ